MPCRTVLQPDYILQPGLSLIVSRHVVLLHHRRSPSDPVIWTQCWNAKYWRRSDMSPPDFFQPICAHSCISVPPSSHQRESAMPWSGAAQLFVFRSKSATISWTASARNEPALKIDVKRFVRALRWHQQWGSALFWSMPYAPRQPDRRVFNRRLNQQRSGVDQPPETSRSLIIYTKITECKKNPFINERSSI